MHEQEVEAKRRMEVCCVTIETIISILCKHVVLQHPS